MSPSIRPFISRSPFFVSASNRRLPVYVQALHTDVWRSVTTLVLSAFVFVCNSRCPWYVCLSVSASLSLSLSCGSALHPSVCFLKAVPTGAGCACGESAGRVPSPNSDRVGWRGSTGPANPPRTQDMHVRTPNEGRCSQPFSSFSSSCISMMFVCGCVLFVPVFWLTGFSHLRSPGVERWRVLSRGKQRQSEAFLLSFRSLLSTSSLPVSGDVGFYQVEKNSLLFPCNKDTALVVVVAVGCPWRVVSRLLPLP